MRRLTKAALAVIPALILLAACTKPETASPAQAQSLVSPAAATPLDGLVGVIASEEAHAAAQCREGKASACADRDYAARNLKDRGYCQDVRGAWSKCPSALAQPAMSSQ